MIYLSGSPFPFSSSGFMLIDWRSDRIPPEWGNTLEISDNSKLQD